MLKAWSDHGSSALNWTAWINQYVRQVRQLLFQETSIRTFRTLLKHRWNVLRTIQLVYCKEPSVSGIQVDHKAFSRCYVQPMTDFIGYLSEFLRDENETVGCRNDNFTEGRAVTVLFRAIKTRRSTKLGESSYYVFSLYDLDPKPEAGGLCTTPLQSSLSACVRDSHIRRVVGNTQKFQIALGNCELSQYETCTTDEQYWLWSFLW